MYVSTLLIAGAAWRYFDSLMQLYAVIKTAGQEYRVSPGKTVKVDRLDMEPGQAIEFDQISKLVKGEEVAIGEPLVAGARVRAEVVKHGQNNGIIVFKMNRRRLYQKKNDKLRRFTVLRVNEIVYGDEIFDKRDTDVRKLKKARAAEQAERKKQEQAVPPVAPKPETRPVAPTIPQPVREKPAPAKPVASPPATGTAAVPAATNRSRKWPAAVALLILLALVGWWAMPTAPRKTEPTPAEILLQQTRAVDQPSDPTQPPD